ncbi:MAG: 3-hydroxyacyl-CoA dehydrogenase family protein [Planctomycetota bacterium]|nr:3-hydroxyacyl-CoA dehydrogenase family protein [Planctomycetota bacterium]
MKLSQVIATDDEVFKSTKAFIKSWDKITVSGKQTPGFIVNRVARPFYGEALRIYEEGIADAVTIDWAMKEIGGFRMGPFELMDLIGHDVNYEVTSTVFEAFYYDPRLQTLLCSKTDGRSRLAWTENLVEVFITMKMIQKTQPLTRIKISGQKIFDRILTMLINEACDAVFMNITFS